MRLLRPALLALALAACAWFALGIRQSHEIDQAENTIAAAHPAAGQLRAAGQRLRAAAFLNPDRAVDIDRGRLDLKQHRPAQARRILAGVVADEPQNLDAWIWFTGANLGRPAARLGAARIAALDPADRRAVGR
ncbi:MAG TPA: hypothetical protein VGH67_04600 [Solirubrobacteraceae bacterium]|jgi:predicted Zn-dependent protease